MTGDTVAARSIAGYDCVGAADDAGRWRLRWRPTTLVYYYQLVAVDGTLEVGVASVAEEADAVGWGLTMHVRRRITACIAEAFCSVDAVYEESRLHA